MTLRRLAVLVALTILTLTGCVHRSSSGERFAPWELRGTVVEVTAGSLRVRHKSGQILDLRLDDRTTIVGAEGTATVSALTRGRRVVVNVEPLENGAARAARVRIFG